jgi:glutaredoxin
MLSTPQIVDKIYNLKPQTGLILGKPGCPFCKATYELLEDLEKQGIIQSYETLLVKQDYDEETMREVCMKYGWQPDQKYSPSKPQIFINDGEKVDYVGGNFEFHESRWNQGDNSDGQLVVQGKTYSTPQKSNPLPF